MLLMIKIIVMMNDVNNMHSNEFWCSPLYTQLCFVFNYYFITFISYPFKLLDILYIVSSINSIGSISSSLRFHYFFFLINNSVSPPHASLLKMKIGPTFCVTAWKLLSALKLNKHNSFFTLLIMMVLVIKLNLIRLSCSYYYFRLYFGFNKIKIQLEAKNELNRKLSYRR